MREILKAAAALSLSGSLTVLALLLARRIPGTSRRWQYYIWLIAVFRLVLPLSPENSPVGALFREEAPALPEAVFVSPGSPPFAAGNPAAPASPEIPVAGTEAESLRMPDMAEALALLWLGGALVLLVRKATAYRSFQRYVRAGCREVDAPALLDRLARAGEELGVRRPVELYENPLMASPMLLGLVRPGIVLPSAALSEEDFRYTALHELTHYRRRDLLYKWLVQLTVCLHWWNPLVWGMAREIDRACELACDEAVLRVLEPEERRAYGDTLLRALESGGGYHAAPGAVSLGENAELLKERLGAIMNFRKPAGRTVLLSLLLAAALITGAAAAGTYTGPGRGTELEATASNKHLRAALLAKEYYEEGNIAGFSVAVSFLSPEEQAAWLEQCYEDQEISFFNTVLSLTRELEAEIVNDILERVYEEGAAAFFSVLVNSLDWEEARLDEWIARAAKENTALLSILLKAADRDGELDALEEELTARQMEEYRAAGIVWEDGDYYYQGKLVRIFMDLRSDASCVNLNVNPQGELDVRTERDADGRIQTVREMTRAEAEELFGDMDGPEEGPAGVNVTVPIEREKLKGGAYWMLGEYSLSEGDWIEYDVTAETGERMSIGFCDMEHSPEDVAYYSVSTNRTDGALRCAADFRVDGRTVEPGIYRLFLHAPEGDLGKVSGAVRLSLRQGGFPDLDAEANPYLMTVEELPAAARKAMEQCEIRTWYVIHSEGRQYLYCNGFPWRYGWYPLWKNGEWQVKIRQLRKQDSGYVLLCFPNNGPLSVYVEGKAVRLTDI